MNQLFQKTVIITGAAGGIGKDLARRLAELALESAHVVAVAADVSQENDVRNYVG